MKTDREYLAMACKILEDCGYNPSYVSSSGGTGTGSGANKLYVLLKKLAQDEHEEANKFLADQVRRLAELGATKEELADAVFGP